MHAARWSGWMPRHRRDNIRPILARIDSKERELADALFERLNQVQADLGIGLQRRQIIDDALDPVPSPRGGHENNALIKADAVPVDGARPRLD